MSMIPSKRESFRPVKATTHKRTELPKSTIQSTVLMSVTCIGTMLLHNPIIKATLKTLLPMALPKASPLLPLRAATRLVASSGRLVPPARMVSPITLSLTPQCLASSAAFSTSKFPPMTRQAHPTNKSKTNLYVGADSSTKESELFALSFLAR